MEDMPMPMPMPDGHRKWAMTHMTFFWGKNVEVLFSGWPGYDRLGMYLLALFFVFALGVTVEFLSAVRPAKPGAAAGLVRTGLHAVRVGLAYLVMLAVMSFNVGVLIAAIVGHTVGFLVFGSGALRRGAAAAEADGRLPIGK